MLLCCCPASPVLPGQTPPVFQSLLPFPSSTVAERWVGMVRIWENICSLDAKKKKNPAWGTCPAVVWVAWSCSSRTTSHCSLHSAFISFPGVFRHAAKQLQFSNYPLLTTAGICSGALCHVTGLSILAVLAVPHKQNYYPLSNALGFAGICRGLRQKHYPCQICRCSASFSCTLQNYYCITLPWLSTGHSSDAPAHLEEPWPGAGLYTALGLLAFTISPFLGWGLGLSSPVPPIPLPATIPSALDFHFPQRRQTRVKAKQAAASVLWVLLLLPSGPCSHAFLAT